jgi:hypothetical protein
VGAVLGGRDQVDVAFLHQLAFRQPGHAQSTTSVSFSGCRRTGRPAAARARPARFR